MIKINCDICKKELDDFGALIFSPPFSDSIQMSVDKYHVCYKCFREKIKVLVE